MKRNKKVQKQYVLPLLLLTVFVLFGIQFVLSQLPTSPPSSGAYHPYSDVVCNDCIYPQNIAPNAVATSELADNSVTGQKIVDNAVTSAKVSDGTLIDADISPYANINPQKISGANGWVFSTFTSPLTNTNTWTNIGILGINIPDWNAVMAEITCRPVINNVFLNCNQNCDLSSAIRTKAGVQALVGGGYNATWNQHVIEISQYFPKEIYRAEYYPSTGAIAPSGFQTLQIRANGNVLQLLRTYQGATGFEAAASNWECLLKRI